MNAGKPSKLQLLIVDDHPVVRMGLERLIDNEADLVVCAGAANAVEALDALSSMTVDLAIVDISLGADDGLELIGEIKDRAPDLPVLALSVHSESIFAERALRAGADGYVMKAAAAERLIEAIRRVLDGGIYVSAKMEETLIRKVTKEGVSVVSPIDSLSDRELQVFRLLGQGHGTGEIASDLDLSVKTIETYREQIKQKLELKTGIALVQQAALWVGWGGTLSMRCGRDLGRISSNETKRAGPVYPFQGHAGLFGNGRGEVP